MQPVMVYSLENVVLAHFSKNFYLHTGLIVWTSKKDAAFTHTGFCGWNDPGRVIKAHIKSELHKEAVLKLAARATQPVTALLNAKVREDQLHRNMQLVAVIKTLKFLSRQNVALRGATVRNVQLILLVNGFPLPMSPASMLMLP